MLFRLVMAIMRPLRLLTPCVPLIARRHAALSYRRRSAVPFPHGAIARLLSSCPPFYIAPPIDTRDGEPGGEGACSVLRN